MSRAQAGNPNDLEMILGAARQAPGGLPGLNGVAIAELRKWVVNSVALLATAAPSEKSESSTKNGTPAELKQTHKDDGSNGHNGANAAFQAAGVLLQLGALPSALQLYQAAADG